MRRLLPLLLALPVAIAAQTTADPAPLAAARAGFLRDVLSVSQKLTGQYEAALARTEAELAAAGGYEEALLIRRRRDELKALYPTTDAEMALSLAVPLPVQQARLSGSVEARSDVLTNWRTNGSAAEWSGVRLTPGRYYLELEATLTEIAAPSDALLPGRVRPQERAVFEFHELSLLPGAAESRRSFEIARSQDENSFTSVQVGPMQFTRSPLSLRLGATAGYPGNQIRLRALRLIPAVQETSGVVAQAKSEGPSLESLKKSLAEALSAAQKPLADAYLKRLRELAQSDPALREMAEAEERRVLRLLGSTGQNGASLRLTSASSPLGTFDDLDGARFVPGSGDEGDRFEVEHEGRRLRVHLLWVVCAPVNPAVDAARTKAFREHFRLDDQSTATLGRLAQEFTAGYLEGKPLRLLVRPGRNNDGSVSALVFLPEVGLFQNVLVDQGLAAVAPPKERRAVSETGLLDSLLEREQAARRRNPAPGAWALSENRP